MFFSFLQFNIQFDTQTGCYEGTKIKTINKYKILHRKCEI